MNVKALREKLDLTQEMLSRQYNIPMETISNWENDKETPPPEVIEMLENAVKRYIPRTKEEVLSLPLTVVELRDMCESLIRQGYAEYSVLLSNDSMETGFHGMYFGLSPIEESYRYVTLN